MASSLSSYSKSDPIKRELRDLCAQLEELAPALVDVDDWPGHQLHLLTEAGVSGWGLPAEYGGRPLADAEMLAAYESLAAACLTTTFVMTQRNAACQRISGSANADLKAELLPALCAGKIFATVGISHLTTSRQHLAKPAVGAVESDGSFVLNGTVPWVTGAAAAEHLVTGGTLTDGRQVLFAVPTDFPGVEVREPMPLLALSASQTATVVLTDVRVPRRLLVAGPVENVMKQTAGGAGSLTTSALAIGLTQGILARLAQEAQRRPDLVPIHEALAAEWNEADGDLYTAVEAKGTSAAPPNAETVRQKANSLVLRSAQAFLAASKGAGFVVGHPAERAVREAMFFLVWSCPQPVVSAALREFACVIDDGGLQ
jgi:alkylation response protein AidB-like acyl-CoA dehydrogenase